MRVETLLHPPIQCSYTILTTHHTITIHPHTHYSLFSLTHTHTLTTHPHYSPSLLTHDVLQSTVRGAERAALPEPISMAEEDSRQSMGQDLEGGQRKGHYS